MRARWVVMTAMALVGVIAVAASAEMARFHDTRPIEKTHSSVMYFLLCSIRKADIPNQRFGSFVQTFGPCAADNMYIVSAIWEKDARSRYRDLSSAASPKEVSLFSHMGDHEITNAHKGDAKTDMSILSRIAARIYGFDNNLIRLSNRNRLNLNVFYRQPCALFITHFIQCSLHYMQLPAQRAILINSSDGSDNRSDGDNPGRSFGTSSRPIYGCLVIFLGAVVLKLFFEMIDAPHKPWRLACGAGVIGLLAVTLIVQGTILILTGQWLLQIL